MWETIKGGSENAKESYYWVPESHRNKCNQIIRDAYKDPGLTLPWDEWHECMQQIPHPWKKKIYQYFGSFVDYINYLTGAKRFQEETKEIKPKIDRGKTYDEPRDRPERDRKKEEKEREKPITIPKRKIPEKKIIKETIGKKPTISKQTISNLNIQIFSSRLNLKTTKLPELLNNLKGINSKILNEIKNQDGSRYKRNT